VCNGEEGCDRTAVERLFAGSAIETVDLGLTTWKLFNVRLSSR
jgi:hypothetical protein